MWIEDFPQAIRAGRDVRQDQRPLAAALLAGANLEVPVAGRVEPGGFQALDETERGLFRLETKPELLELGRPSFGFDKHTLGGIADPAFQTQFARQAKDKGAKSDALNRAANRQFQTPCLRL